MTDRGIRAQASQTPLTDAQRRRHPRGIVEVEAHEGSREWRSTWDIAAWHGSPRCCSSADWSGRCASPPPYVAEGCTRRDLDGASVARVWDEQTLDLIRQVVPAPTVHARNLFHVSAAMWDAWAAYDPTADGYFVTEKPARGRRHGPLARPR